MRRDRVDILLQLTFLEGRINTHGAYEKSVARKLPQPLASSDSRSLLERSLEAALAAKSFQEEATTTVGSFLRSLRSAQSLRAQQIFPRIGLSRNIYRMLEQDRISPLKIPLEAWRRLCQLAKLPPQVLGEMIRRTHQLVWFRPSFRTTLARYDARKQKGMKASTLEKAATELYTKAQLSLPADEKAKLDALLKSILEDS